VKLLKPRKARHYTIAAGLAPVHRPKAARSQSFGPVGTEAAPRYPLLRARSLLSSPGGGAVMDVLTHNLVVHAMILTFAWVPFALGAWLAEGPGWQRVRRVRPRFVRPVRPTLAPAH
jgi:hypothetical protein